MPLSPSLMLQGYYFDNKADFLCLLYPPNTGQLCPNNVWDSDNKNFLQKYSVLKSTPLVFLACDFTAPVLFFPQVSPEPILLQCCWGFVIGLKCIAQNLWGSFCTKCWSLRQGCDFYYMNPMVNRGHLNEQGGRKMGGIDRPSSF